MEENNYGADIIELKTDIIELKTRMTNVEKNNDRHENLINELDNKSANNRSEIAILNNNITELNGNIDLLRQEIASSSSTNRELCMKMENLLEKHDMKINGLEEKISEIKKENEDRKKEELENIKYNKTQIKNIIFKCLGTIAAALVSAALVYFGLQ